MLLPEVCTLQPRCKPDDEKARKSLLDTQFEKDLILTVDDVAQRLNVSKDWVWDHSSRKYPLLPVIRFGNGTLRYKASRIEEFIDEQERLKCLRENAVSPFAMALLF
jgi:predicted DNA-binding transcriptional regulator AlpA